MLVPELSQEDFLLSWVLLLRFCFDLINFGCECVFALGDDVDEECRHNVYITMRCNDGTKGTHAYIQAHRSSILFILNELD